MQCFSSVSFSHRSPSAVTDERQRADFGLTVRLFHVQMTSAFQQSIHQIPAGCLFPSLGRRHANPKAHCKGSPWGHPTNAALLRTLAHSERGGTASARAAARAFMPLHENSICADFRGDSADIRQTKTGIIFVQTVAFCKQERGFAKIMVP